MWPRFETQSTYGSYSNVPSSKSGRRRAKLVQDLDDYHNLIARVKCDAESTAKVTKLLLGEFAGLAGPKSQSRDFWYAFEGKIQNTYDKGTAAALLELVQVTSKTWMPTPQVLSCRQTEQQQ
ncbi:hypothetical protein LTR47_011430 [Exophiala xenobiotica]|nr:hypothetical protein LTR92_011299 [Exophiala xenobiotica]KAK5215495.1 hypothetical protein LTR72_011451 [Exophiala xenobiotica]KAK5219767.1 hypothetical protein LTR47_011430 [Exophiala xenobiotica]KAK5244000.1 hypothetical protein LTS06_010350 [Exophiala xenobiotica]KAK5260653.1 hypothetical protein LTR40_003746 [Exophiala xenobiotica]